MLINSLDVKSPPPLPVPLSCKHPFQKKIVDSNTEVCCTDKQSNGKCNDRSPFIQGKVTLYSMKIPFLINLPVPLKKKMCILAVLLPKDRLVQY